MAFDRGDGSTGTGQTSILPIEAGGTGANTALTAFSNLSEGNVVVDSSGNVGIGTSSPGEKLQVNGNIAQTSSGFLSQTNGTNTVYWQLNPLSISNSFGVATGQSIPFIVGNNNTERMRIDSSGNVGIGTSSPGSTLDVNGVINNTNGVVFYRQTNTGTANNGFILGTVAKATAPSGGSGSLQIFSNDASNQLQGYVELVTSATAAERRLRISAVEQGVAFRDITLAESGGNVGIGTSSPGAKLDVVGTSAGVTPLTVRHPGNASFGTVIQVRTTAGTDDPVISLENYNGGSPVRYGISCTDNGSMAFLSGAYDVAFGTERMRIDSSGNVGIGTSSPARKLHVSDVMRLEPRNGAPSSPAKGDIYFDSADDKLKCYDGSVWQDLF